MVGAPFSPQSSSMATNPQNKYAPPQYSGHQQQPPYATPNATLSTVLPYVGTSSAAAPYPPTPSGYPLPPTAQPYTTNNFPMPNYPPAAGSVLGQTYPPTNNNNYAYPPPSAPPQPPPSNCFSQLTPAATYPPSYSSGYPPPPSVYPAGPQGTYPPPPPGGRAGVWPPPPSGNVYPPPPY